MIAGTITIALIAGGIYLLLRSTPEKEHKHQVSTALVVCQRMIANTAKFGEADTPPYVANEGTGDKFEFAWPHGSFEFSNGFGARVKMSATCRGTLSPLEVQYLSVNGEEFHI